MAVQIIMPKWGLTMKEGKISRWFKQEGDPVSEGEDLFEVETEKITNTVESPGNGTLARILVKVGETVEVGTLLAVVAEPGEDPEQIKIGETSTPEVQRVETKTEKGAPTETHKKKTFVPGTPAARRLAKESGVDLALVQGTGPGGRITEADVAAFVEQAPPEPRMTPLAREMAKQEGLDVASISGTGERGRITREDVARALSPGVRAPEKKVPNVIGFGGMRKAIADNMHASLQNTAQLSVFAETDVTEMVKFRKLVQEEYRKDETFRVSYNDIIIMAASRALKRFPIMNSTLIGDEIILHDSVHMGIAVSLDEGLIVPVLHDADSKGLLQIARESRQLSRKAREGNLTVDDVTGGTFTISNVSMLEVDGFTPILRPPETGILGVGRVKEKPAVVEGAIAIRAMMFLSLTFDHRVVDGAPAMAFLETVGRCLGQPALIMAF